MLHLTTTPHFPDASSCHLHSQPHYLTRSVGQRLSLQKYNRAPTCLLTVLARVIAVLDFLFACTSGLYWVPSCHDPYATSLALFLRPWRRERTHKISATLIGFWNDRGALGPPSTLPLLVQLCVWLWDGQEVVYRFFQSHHLSSRHFSEMLSFRFIGGGWNRKGCNAYMWEARCDTRAARGFYSTQNFILF